MMVLISRANGLNFFRGAIIFMIYRLYLLFLRVPRPNGFVMTGL
jgi:hypothetical protein